VISCVLSVCSETVVIDRLSNFVSAINIFETISIESFPVVIPRVFCLFELVREHGDPLQLPGLVTFKLGDTEITRTPYDIDFQGAFRTRTVLNIQGLVVAGPGTLRVSIDADGKTLGHWDILCEGRPAQIKFPLQEERNSLAVD